MSDFVEWCMNTTMAIVCTAMVLIMVIGVAGIGYAVVREVWS